MEARTVRYGGREFDPATIAYVRLMAIGGKIRVSADRSFWRKPECEALATLAFKGLCTAQSDGGTGKYETLTYRATDALFDLHAKQLACTVTFEALAGKMGRDISLAACRSVNRSYRRRPAAFNDHSYPSIRDVSHRALVESQGPLFTVDPGDEAVFSSRGLTDWYVGQFVQSNHLKR